MKKAIVVFVLFVLLMGGFSMMQIFAADSLLTVNKTAFSIDEPITVTAQGSGTDWVGIYFPGEPHSIRWVYVTDVGSGVEFDMRTVGEVNQGAPETLGTGRYIIRLMPNDSTNLGDALAEIEITIGDISEDTLVNGDASRLSIEKTVFAFGEPITVSAIGSGTDWVGIYFPGEPHSIRWVYVADIGEGVEFDISTVGEVNDGAPDVISEGEYVIRLMPNDSTNTAEAIAWVTIEVVASENDMKRPQTPLAVTYDLADAKSGFATGKLTVTLAEGDSARHIIPYWADANGKLKGYTSLAKFKVKGSETTYEYGKNLMIPQGATKLLVYTANGEGELCEEPYEVELPAGAAFKDLGTPIVEFQSVSDIHIRTEQNHKHNQNFKKLLKDVAANSKNSIGIFINGDTADNGRTEEWQMFHNLYTEVEGLPPYFVNIGNHEFKNNSYDSTISTFLSYAKLPDGTNAEGVHYDFWLNGYHFVFLGNDRMPVNEVQTTLLPTTIKWLDNTLAKDRDEGRPTFLFLHQSLYNTVAGSLPGEGWNGVASENGLRSTLAKYPEVILFNGHSHWELDSKSTMYARDDKLPTIFNTASVGYLWTGYNVVGGENLDGSQGYYVRVYEDCVLVLGRDFTTGEWVPSAQFYVPYEKKETLPPDTTDTPESTETPATTDSPVTTDTPITTDSPVGTDSPATTDSPAADVPVTSEQDGPSDDKPVSLVPILLGVGLGVMAIAAACVFVILKKKK